MLSGLFMLFSSFNPIICGLLLTAGIVITLQRSPRQSRPLDLPRLASHRQLPPAGELHHASRQ
jgi:hypothetical protein